MDVANLSSKNTAEFLTLQIARAKQLRAMHASSPSLAARRLVLRQWQVDRLTRTYQDLLDDPRFRRAAEFFLSDLYGPGDTTQRDADIERAYPIMTKLLPELALHSIGLALELDALSEELDLHLLDELEAIGMFSGGRSKGTLDEAIYADAYRRCDNYRERRHQIDLTRQVGQDLALVVGKPFMRSLLRTMRTPAKLAGFGELQSFLERGFDAFRQTEDIQEFLDTVERREVQILDRIYTRHPQPFAQESPSV
jgi:hypothetical protein